MICKLCGEEKKLIKSHIIPESFYRDAYTENEGIMVRKDDHSKRLPIGVYDKEIVCEDCEKKFQKWDEYGYKFFNEILPSLGKVIQVSGKNIGLLFDDIKYKELKLFLMAILWRAGVSGDGFFDQISLGKFENSLKDKILKSDPGSQQEFAVLFFKFDLSKYDVLHPPFKTRLDSGVNGYRFFFFNAEIFIKVDKREMQYPRLILSPDQSLIVSFKDAPQALKQLDASRSN
jgi:hypothetical protein